jgi:YbgC/YbaW family acyl-CoA thioester hydrolase
MTTESKHLIRFQDCDPFNHLNNSKYLDYFLCAREDQLSTDFGFDVFEYTKKTAKSWVVGLNQIAYFSPALLMENVTIQTSLLEWNTYDILVEMQMWNANKSKCKAVLWTKFVHFDFKTQKKTEHSSYLNSLFANKVNNLPQKISFEERIKEIKL